MMTVSSIDDDDHWLLQIIKKLLSNEVTIDDGLKSSMSVIVIVNDLQFTDTDSHWWLQTIIYWDPINKWFHPKDLLLRLLQIPVPTLISLRIETMSWHLLLIALRMSWRYFSHILNLFASFPFHSNYLAFSSINGLLAGN